MDTTQARHIIFAAVYMTMMYSKFTTCWAMNGTELTIPEAKASMRIGRILESQDVVVRKVQRAAEAIAMTLEENRFDSG